jgi:nucleotidyltransferase/DNA polymerase involved in DNA repair
MNKTAKSELQKIPGVGKSIARDLQNIGINSIADLRGINPETLYAQSNQFAGITQDRCLLYVFAARSILPAGKS